MSAHFFSHHKCATTWLHALFTDLASRNGLTYISTIESDRLLDGGADIAFYANASYAFVRHHELRGCHLVRNPLSIIVSAYFSHLLTHGDRDWPQLSAQREVLRSVDRADGMLLTTAFLERADFHPRALGPLLGLRTWDYDDARFLTLRMEDVVLDPTSTLRTVFGRELAWPPGEAFTFSAFAGGRSAGQVDETSHYRSGSPEDWKLHLPSAAVRYVETNFRHLLERCYREVASAIRLRRATG